MRKNKLFLTLVTVMFLVVTFAPSAIAEARIVIQQADNGGAVVTSEDTKAFGFYIQYQPGESVKATYNPGSLTIVKETSPGNILVAGSRTTVLTIYGSNWTIIDPQAMDENGNVGPASIVDKRLPTGFTLAQNYPNPFNPETEISFSVPTGGPVELTIYNALGQRVATLVSEIKPAGAYTIRWSATDNFGVKVTSGVYFCRLKQGGASATRRMTLLK